VACVQVAQGRHEHAPVSRLESCPQFGGCPDYSHAAFRSEARKCGVVASQHGDFLAGGVQFAKAVQGDGLSVAHSVL
jgi:hypothetical protein